MHIFPCSSLMCCLLTLIFHTTSPCQPRSPMPRSHWQHLHQSLKPLVGVGWLSSLWTTVATSTSSASLSLLVWTTSHNHGRTSSAASLHGFPCCVIVWKSMGQTITQLPWRLKHIWSSTTTSLMELIYPKAALRGSLRMSLATRYPKGSKDSNLVVVSMLSKGLSVVNPIEGGLDLDKMLADARKAPLLSE